MQGICNLPADLLVLIVKFLVHPRLHAAPEFAILLVSRNFSALRRRLPRRRVYDAIIEIRGDVYSAVKNETVVLLTQYFCPLPACTDAVHGHIFEKRLGAMKTKHSLSPNEADVVRAALFCDAKTRHNIQKLHRAYEKYRWMVEKQ